MTDLSDLRLSDAEARAEAEHNGARVAPACRCSRPLPDADGTCSKCGRAAAEVVGELSPIGDTPRNEAVARELAPLRGAANGKRPVVRRADVEAACERLGTFTTKRLAAEVGLSVNATSGHVQRLRRDGVVEAVGGGSYRWVGGGAGAAAVATNGTDPDPPTRVPAEPLNARERRRARAGRP